MDTLKNDVLKKAWKYDPTARTVTKDGNEVVCTIQPGQPDSLGYLLACAPTMSELLDKLPAILDGMGSSIARVASIADTGAAPGNAQVIGHLLARAPALAAIAHDLHSQLGESLDAWHGEEDSVQEEHSDLIKNLEAADARATALLDPSGAASLPAEVLRALAHSLLDRAHQIDGLQPYVVTHSHRFGQTVYTAWSAGVPSETQMASLLEEKFEADRGETLESHRLEIAELTGSAPSSVLAQMSDEGDQDDEGGDRPAGM